MAITPGYSPISSPYGAVVNGGQWFTKDYTIDGTSGTAEYPRRFHGRRPQHGSRRRTAGADQRAGCAERHYRRRRDVVQPEIGNQQAPRLGLPLWTQRTARCQHLDQRQSRTGQAQGAGLGLGLSLGGPIRKNKTFFFGTFERFQSIDFRLGSGGATVPTADFLNGDFSALMGPTLCNFGGTTDLCSNCRRTMAMCPASPIMVQDNAGQTGAGPAKT